jgi:ComF family protein
VNNEIEVFKCLGVYKLLEEPFCQVCGNPDVTTDKCVWHGDLYGFNRIYVMGKYFQVRRGEADLLSSHILMLKTDKEYAIPLGRALALAVHLSYPELLRSDMLVPIPLHLEEFKQRGYNQALELANVVSERLNIPVLHALEKTKPLKMKPLTRLERKKAVKDLYKILEYRRNDIRDKDLILVDDVVTTGFDVSECSDVLIKSGAAKVDVLTLARTVM